MPPTVILIRHAEALHNVTDDWSLHDPALTDLGLQQSRELGEALKKVLPGRFDVQLVVVSPMIRTLQTATLALGWLREAGVPMQAHAGWQETTSNPCDIGSPIEELAQSFPEVDFSLVDPVFPDKTSEQGRAYAYNRRALVARAQSALGELHGRPEPVVAVVSHSSFLSKATVGSMFGNADYRIFSFGESECDDDGVEADGSKEEPAVVEGAPKLSPPAPVAPDLPPLQYRLREWEETRSSRGGMGRSFELVRSIGEGLPG